MKINSVLFFTLLLVNICSTSLWASKVDSLENLLASAGNIKKTQILNELASYFVETDPARAIKYSRQALELAKEIKCKDCEAKSLYYTGIGYSFQNNYSQSHEYLRKALVIYQILKNEKAAGDVFSRLGLVSYQIGYLDKALEYHLKSLASYSKLIEMDFDKKTINKCIIEEYLNLSSVYWKLQNLEKTMEYSQNAVKLAQKIPADHNLAVAYTNLGKVYKEINYKEKSKEYLLKAVAIDEKIDNTSTISITYKYLGELFFLSNDWQGAIGYYKKALRIDLRMLNKPRMTENYINIGRVNTKLRQFKEAADYLERGLSNAKNLNDKTLIRNSYFAMYELYELQNDNGKALDNYKLYNQIKDSLNGEVDKIKIAEIETRFNVVAQEKEISMLSKNNELNRTAINNQRMLIYLISLISVVVLIFTFLQFRQYRKNKKTMLLLSKKNEEVEAADKELRRVNSELAKKEERFRIMVQNMPVLINAIGDNGQIVFWNKECERVTGYWAGDMLENPEALRKLYPNDKVQKRITDNFNSFTDFKNIETEILCRNGDKKIISWSNVSNSAQVSGWKFWAIGTDVTERVLFESSLIQEKALLNSLINSIPDLIFYKDPKGVYLGVNTAFCRFYSKTPEDFIGKTDFDIFPRETALIYHKNDQEVLSLKVEYKRAKWKTQYNSKPVVLDTVKVAFKDDEKNVLGLVGICRDITDKYIYEEALKEQKEQAIEADKQKSAFLANMSHEIRTPMNAIIGFSDLLSKSIPTEEQRQEYLSYISSCGKDLLHLIDDIIDIAKIEADQIKIVKTNCPVNKILTELQATFTQEKKRKNKDNVELRLVRQTSDVTLTVFSDPYRFRQILANLIGNALKFTDHGYIEFGFTETTGTIKGLEQEAKNFLQFYVKDTGIGMPMDKLKIIFDRFAQIEDPHGRNLAGTGLGLAISKSLVELLGGKIWAESEINHGSTFYFTVPYDKIEQRKPTETQQPLSKKTYEWKDKVILIAEDDRMNYRLLEQALMKTEVKIFWAQNGEQAVEMAVANSAIELILMDIQMPKKNGYTATKEIKAMRPTLPVIAQTAFAMAGEKERSRLFGCDEFITKPIIPRQLMDMMSKYLDKIVKNEE